MNDIKYSCNCNCSRLNKTPSSITPVKIVLSNTNHKITKKTSAIAAAKQLSSNHKITKKTSPAAATTN